jgi:serine/threonine-protein kinase
MAGTDDRNVLIGLLAFQTGLVDELVLIEAFRVWSQTRHTPLVDFLCEQGALTPDARARLEERAEKHLLPNGGDPRNSVTALSATVTTHSATDAADTDLDKTMPHAGYGATPTHGASNLSGFGAPPEQSQRFRILRPHARGGLGAVFVALDGELNREVALKQILDHHADDPINRQRFLQEAEITGGLEHPGIVPVYGLGRYADGRPYYAMRFVKGDSLKDAIARFHGAKSGADQDPGKRALELRKLLRRFMDVCDAVEYAHSRGVLHRDLKPANVMVGRYGETMLVDWGLAKVMGRPDTAVYRDEPTMELSGNGTAETLPGAAVGTPAFMSPEQTIGDPDVLGPPSDVYSLGATLYCLLTGRLPFDGRVGDLLHAIRRGQFPSPRAIDKTIDPALEAICLKAMALRPEKRYQSAKALEEDLERWIAGEPVMAWREPLSRRLRRWIGRHRMTVTAAAAALGVAVVALGVLSAVVARDNTRLEAKNTALANANRREAKANKDLQAANVRVQARYALALRAIKTLHSGVGEDLLLREEKFKGLRDRLLQSASDFYDQLAALLEEQPDLASRRALGQARFELAQLTERVGRRDKALAIHENLLNYRESLASDAKNDTEAQADVARSLLAVGVLFTQQGRVDEAEKAYERAHTVLEAASRNAPDVAEYRAELARAENLHGFLLSRTANTADALKWLQQARDRRAQLIADEIDLPEIRRELAESHNLVGALLARLGRPDEARAELGKALGLEHELSEADPETTRLRTDLALSHHAMGTLLLQAGKHDEALEAQKKALALRRALADEHPNVSRFQADLVQSHNAIGFLRSRTGKTADALTEFAKALELAQALCQANPNVNHFQAELALSHHNIGLAHTRAGNLRQALAAHTKALELRRELATTHPQVTRFQTDLAHSYFVIGQLLTRMRRYDEALESHEKALQIEQVLADNNPNLYHMRARLSRTLAAKGRLLDRAGRPEESANAYRRAISAMESLPTFNSEAEIALARFHALLSGLATQPRSGVTAGEGEAEAEKAIQWLRRASAVSAANVDHPAMDQDFRSIRKRPKFQALMLDLTFPKDPFEGHNADATVARTPADPLFEDPQNASSDQ